MTILRRMAQLIKDLREVHLIKDDDCIDYRVEENYYTIVISNSFHLLSAKRIYLCFLDEFSPEEIDYKHFSHNSVTFSIHRIQIQDEEL